MTRPSRYVFTLSEQDQAVLQERARAYSGSHAEVVRAKIVLLAAQGEPNTVIAARLNVHVDVVSRWRKRFYEQGVEGLRDWARSGRPRQFAPRPP